MGNYKIRELIDFNTSYFTPFSSNSSADKPNKLIRLRADALQGL